MKVNIDINEIKKYLPHRYPFLLVDRVIDLEETKITGIKNVTVNEPFFEGHFPGHPVMPGVLMLEALAQTLGILVLQKEENRGKMGYFASMDKVKFRKPVFPGDTLKLEVSVTKHRARIVQAHCEAKVGEETAAEADLMLSILDVKK